MQHLSQVKILVFLFKFMIYTVLLQLNLVLTFKGIMKCNIFLLNHSKKLRI